ncbi:MAG: hypothetical protein ACRC6L_13260 [Steroidobacteraceae bacterium]
MSAWSSYALVIAATFVLNVPFGYWRAGVVKFSAQWFVAVHAVVPLVVYMRHAAGLPFRWSLLPLFVTAYFGGQYLGSRWRLKRGSQPNRP